MQKLFSQLCTPAKIYFTLAILSIIISLLHGFHVSFLISHLIVTFIWTYFLAWLCKKGYKSISWFLVLAPFIMIFLIALGVMREIKIISSMNPIPQTMNKKQKSPQTNSTSQM
jgi:predicted PurR-regulated permease PerM